MPGPLDALVYVHNAIRTEVDALEREVSSLETGNAQGFQPLIERFAVLSQFMDDHEKGEEAFFFPALEARAPFMIEAYVMDHRNNDAVLDNVRGSLDALGLAASPAEAHNAARGLFVHTVELRATLSLHLRKEERHLVGVTERFYSKPEQGALVGKISANVPPERVPQMAVWMFARMSREDRAGMLRIMQGGMPAPAFTGLGRILEGGLAAEEWTDLVQRMPELTQSLTA
jgi:hypothetical protein